jgi:F-type H+-transporting ATPase subunit delta
MGAQTRQSLDQAKELLVGHSGMTEDLGANLFAAALGLSGSKALRVALTDSSSEPSRRIGLAASAFASLSTDAKTLLGKLVVMKWSNPDDLQAALEDLAIRVFSSTAESSAGVGELLAISTLVHSDPELELALGSKRASGPAKASLIGSLVQGKVSQPTAAIVAHLVQDPRGRRIGQMLTTAAETVADQSGQGLAIVTVAKKLSAPQRASIEALLRSRYGRDHYVAEVINPEVVGGAKIRVGNDVIDGTIQTRLLDLRTKLAG